MGTLTSKQLCNYCDSEMHTGEDDFDCPICTNLGPICADCANYCKDCGRIVCPPHFDESKKVCIECAKNPENIDTDDLLDRRAELGREMIKVWEEHNKKCAEIADQIDKINQEISKRNIKNV